jgi:eukaryotic-like serine/threonine-protein kinase
MNDPSDRWRMLDELYQAAVEREPATRAAFLSEACPDDSLRREVASLLDARDAGDHLLERSAIRYALADLAPGQTLAQYRVVAKLGEGGMGAVYRAHDTRLDREVALKMLPPERFADAESKQRLMREARAASALNHPNIVSIYEAGSDSGVDSSPWSSWTGSLSTG